MIKISGTTETKPYPYRSDQSESWWCQLNDSLHTAVEMMEAESRYITRVTIDRGNWQANGGAPHFRRHALPPEVTDACWVMTDRLGVIPVSDDCLWSAFQRERQTTETEREIYWLHLHKVFCISRFCPFICSLNLVFLFVFLAWLYASFFCWLFSTTSHVFVNLVPFF